MPLGNSTGYASSVLSNTFLTTAAQSGHSHGNPTLALTNLSGTTGSASNGFTLSLSAAAPGAGGGIAMSAGSDSLFTSGTVSFGNANGFSFLTSNGSVVGSYTDAGGAGGGLNTINLIGNVSGNTSVSQNAGSLYLSGGPRITLSGTGNTVVIVNAPDVVSSYLVPIGTNMPLAMCPAFNVPITLGTSATNYSAFFLQFSLDTNVKATGMMVPFLHQYSTASNSSGVAAHTIRYGIFTQNNSTLSLMSSNSFSLICTNSSVSGTLSYPASCNTNGFTYSSVTWSASSQTASLFPNNTAVWYNLPFTDTLSLSSGPYYLGLIKNYSSTNSRVALYQLNLAVAQAGIEAGTLGTVFGSYSSAILTQITDTFQFGRNVYVATSTGEYGGTNLPSSIHITRLSRNTSPSIPAILFRSI